MKKFFYLFSVFFVFSGLFSSEFTDFAKQRAISFDGVEDVNELISYIPDVRLVLLGESTHGTSEYYQMRAEISKKLISEKGYSFVAVEGDWASLYRLNRYVKGLDNVFEDAKQIMMQFNRWPEWMWANKEVLGFIEWIKQYNDLLPEEKKVGFYGMDVYGQWEAMEKLLEYINNYAPEYYKKIKEKTKKFTAYGNEEWTYAIAVSKGNPSAESDLKGISNFLKEKKDELIVKGAYEYFNAVQNALVLKNAEDFFRLAISGGNMSWNSRVHHMNKTVNNLLYFYGGDSKGIVWAHNTHVGDSRATSMHREGSVNIGKLSRKELGRENVFIIGFATYAGKVLAGNSWGSPMHIMSIPPAIPGSLEDELQAVGKEKFYLVFNDFDRKNSSLLTQKFHRAIGVVYNPMNELGNYVPTIVPERYDVLVFFSYTEALDYLGK